MFCLQMDLGIHCPDNHNRNNICGNFPLQRIKSLSFFIFLQAVINYGASWCRVCSQILPAFCHLSNSFAKLSFIYADIDECPETTQHIRYTTTFHFYRDGKGVDEMFGAGEERLHDQLWLHS
ncbi:thioredoxin-like 3-3 [Pyrus x bretschneideri]|uniref:thioredoxin-like 3-3 n=1 Tax=Pyrus x bretschneideri TaxID=225117 RepID=UPI00202FD0AD|nr:thioredoxin-like 3-3 [Pyrus x bretschneideri]